MQERRYRAYVTDVLKIIAENTARFAGGSVPRERWADAFAPRDERDGDEIVKDVIRRSGLKHKGGEARGA